MSYTPTNWQTGDTITAEKMNNIENGIVNAPKVAVVSLDAEGFGTASHIFGYVVYATYEDNRWVVIADDDLEWVHIQGIIKPYWRVIPPQYTIIPSENMCPFFIPNYVQDQVNIETTGDIEQTDNLYFGYGSHIEYAYRLYGNGSIKIIAL